jgi:hypothetical protein
MSQMHGREHTFMESIHVQLADKRGYVGMLEVLAAKRLGVGGYWHVALTF